MEDTDPVEFLSCVTRHCGQGKPMHQESLKNVVLKLTQISRLMHLRQAQRDEAAQLATELANAALKAYGANSEFGFALRRGIQSILNGTYSRAS